MLKNYEIKDVIKLIIYIKLIIKLKLLRGTTEKDIKQKGGFFIFLIH